MLLKKVYSHADWLFSVYAGEDGRAALVAVVPAIGWYDVAMILNADEKELLQQEDKEDLVLLARDFVASRDMPIFRDRKIAVRHIDAETIEIDDADFPKA